MNQLYIIWFTTYSELLHVAIHWIQDQTLNITLKGQWFLNLAFPSILLSYWTQWNITYHRNTNTRFTLAADCLDALRKCFTSNTLIPSNVESKQKKSLHELLRESSFISPDVVCSIVELGQLFDQNVIQYRINIFGDASETESQEGNPTTLTLNSSLRLEFEQWERRLW